MSRVPSRSARGGVRSIASAPAAAGFRPAAAALAVAAAFALQPAQAQPAGGTAASGSFTTQAQGNTFIVNTVNGAGNRSVINWQSFSVPGGTITDFRQPSASSTSINRVTGGARSDIFGTLTSNGNLVLVNPSGIAFGPNAMVNTAGFTASTLDLDVNDAVNGRLLFKGGSSDIHVGDGARILARSGDVVLVGSQVQVDRNAVVQASGATILAAGEKVELLARGLEGIQLEVKAGNQAVNLGTLQGDAVGIFAGTLRHSGLVQAQAASTEGGKVVLKAVGGDALVDGTVLASAANGKGGNVDVLGNRVGLLAGAAIEASGATGGGVVRIGGDGQGRNADVPNAQAVYFDANASVKADATARGDGGRVIVWSDGLTRMNGRISARGGVQGGNGGFSEVSGKKKLEFTGDVDLRAPAGAIGTLLLDPEDITIVHSASPTSTNTFPQSNPADPPSGAMFEPSATGPVALTDTQLNNQLAASNVLVKTSSTPSTGSGGQITVNSDASIAWSTPNKLEFVADKGVAVNGAIYGGNAGSSLAMTAKAGDIVFNSGASVVAGSINLQAQGGGSIDAGAVTLDAPGDVALTATNNIRFGGIHTGAQSGGTGANSGKVTLKAGGDVGGDWISTYGDYHAGGDAGNAGAVSVTAGGGITMNSIAAYGGNSYELTPTSTPAPPPTPPGKGGNGGAIKLDAGGNITVDSIEAGAGSSYGGSSFASGPAGSAGRIDLRAGGDIAANSMDVSGGDGFAGSAGGQVAILEGNNLQFGTITASGGGSSGAAKAGQGGIVDVSVAGTVTLTTYRGDDAVNADGGSGGSGAGGDGGSISLKAGAIQTAPQTPVEYSFSPYYGAVTVSASGGYGGSPSTGNAGTGGNGGRVRLDAAQPLVMDGALIVMASGGDGGSASATGSGLGGGGGSGGTVDLRSASAVHLRGAVVLAGAGQGGYASDDATQAASGTMGSFAASGTSVDVEGDFVLDGNWTNNSVVNLRGASGVFASGAFRNAGEVNLYDTSYLFAAALDNAGKLRTFGSEVGATLTRNTGLVEVNAGSTFDAPTFFDNAGTLVVDGTLNIGSSATPPPTPGPAPAPGPVLLAAVGPGAVFTNQASATIAGNGTINVDSGRGTVDNHGTLSPGGNGAIGTLTLNAGLSMEAGSTYAADLLNTRNVDTLLVSGGTSTGGTVAVNYLPGAAFAAGDSFRVLQSGGLDPAAPLPTVSQPELRAQASGNDVLLVATSSYPPAPSADAQGAQQVANNQVASFALLFEQMSEQQQQDAEDRRIGRDDIVVTDTACTR